MEIEVSLDDAKQIEFSLLLEFRRICKKYELNYSLAYGTLLGAIRHHGFIPWDDDIDVMMPRKDFMKFMQVSKYEFNGSPYNLISMYNCSSYFAPLPKMSNSTTKVYQNYGQIERIKTGIYIDIFIVDGLPLEYHEQYYKQASKIRYAWGMSCRKFFAKHQSRNLLFDIAGSLLSIPYKIKGINYYRNKYDEWCSQYDFYNSEYVAVLMFGEGLEKEKMQRNDFLDFSIVEFEGEKFRAVKNPDEYLTNMYGNYMQLPPVEERVGKHPNKMVRIVSDI